MKNILVTDSLFIFPRHIRQLEEFGFSVTRVDKPEATEDELIESLKGKQGYILGGIEKVTERVIRESPELEVISFTGSDYRYFIPGFELAKEKGIVVTNCPGTNSFAVSEYTITLILAMTREIFDLGRTGSKTFKTTRSLEGEAVGIIGMGYVGEKVARALKALGVQNIYYFSRTRKPELEKEMGIIFTTMEDLVSRSDIVSLHASKEIGDRYFDKHYLSKMKEGGILINCSFESAINFEDLLPYLKSGTLRCAHDGTTPSAEYAQLPLYNWFNSNAHTAYNTEQANLEASNIATQSVMNILSGKEDKYKVL